MTDIAPYRLIDLFAGCGGMTLGFTRTGRFEPALAVERDADAAATYIRNFPGHSVHARPIQDVAKFPSADLVIGGPPCQAFSPLNRAGVGPERRELWREYLRALDDARPAVFVMENVPELLKAVEFADFEAAVRARGWNVEGRILDAADYGVPQRRRRAVVIGTRAAGPVPFPSHTHYPPGELRPADAPTWRTFADATAGLPLEPDGRAWHRARNPRPESIVRYRAVPPNGGNRFEMQENLDRAGLGHLVPACWRNKTSGTTDVFGRLRWDEPSCTIRTEFYKPEKGRYLHPVADRPITVREAARCMSFPDAFVFPEHQSMTSVGRQIGNAVPPLMAQAVADAVLAALETRASGRATRAA